MTATTSTGGLGAAAPRHGSGRFFKSLFESYVASRQLKAMNIVDAHLRSMDDNTLSRLGYTPELIRRLRAGESVRPE